MKNVKKLIREKLAPIYSTNETDSLLMLILEYVTGYSRLQIHLHSDDQLSAPKIAQIENIVNRLTQNEPIQYILGETSFYGLIFKVSKAVLIPRAETEELVDWIVTNEKERCKSLLDIGTGSGCIPISIDKNCSIPRIDAWDVSPEALAVAVSNATSLDSKVNFSLFDLFLWPTLSTEKKWDVIVSNPPYVTENDRILMAKNVVDFEPHIALFVTDEDPLIFYRTIAEFTLVHLNDSGRLYFEINESYGKEVVKLLENMGFCNIQIANDLQGKARMMMAEKEFFTIDPKPHKPI